MSRGQDTRLPDGVENGRADYIIIPVVAPASNDPNLSGKVINLHCGGGVCHRQLWRDPTSGYYELHPGYHRRGWRLLSDMYHEENDEEGWKHYQRYLAAWQKGQTRSPFAPHRLPKSVQERQRCMLPDEFADEFRAAPTLGTVKPEPAAPEKPADEPAKPNKRNPAPEARS